MDIWTKAFADGVAWSDAQALIRCDDLAKFDSARLQWKITWADGYEPLGEQVVAGPSTEHGGPVQS